MRRPLALFIIIVVSAGVALASPPPNAPALLSDLGSDDFAVRQKATAALLAAGDLTVEDVVQLAAAAKTAEQRARLTLIAKHHFVRPLQEQRAREATWRPADEQGAAKDAPGSLGVNVVGGVKAVDLPELGCSAARIGVTYPGFPAYVYLQPGDLIVSVDDERLPDRGVDEAQVQTKFISLIHDKGAGNTVRFGVYRDGQLIQVSIRLANYDTLLFMYTQGMTATLRPLYLPQWSQVLRKLEASKPAAPPLTVDLDVAPPAPLPGEADEMDPFSRVE